MMPDAATTETLHVDTRDLVVDLAQFSAPIDTADRALGLTAEEMANAFGIVYSSVAGNHQVTRVASLMNRLQPGLAAQAAAVAVQLAKQGIRRAQNLFEGRDGFIRVYLRNEVELAALREDLGRRFELLNSSYKPYPCCRAVHTMANAVLQLRAETGRPAQDIKSISVGVTGPRGPFARRLGPADLGDPYDLDSGVKRHILESAARASEKAAGSAKNCLTVPLLPEPVLDAVAPSRRIQRPLRQ